MWEDLDQFHNFGKFLAVFGTFLESFWSGIWQTFVPTLAIFMLPGNFQWFKRPKSEKYYSPLVTLNATKFWWTTEPCLINRKHLLTNHRSMSTEQPQILASRKTLLITSLGRPRDNVEQVYVDDVAHRRLSLTTLQRRLWNDYFDYHLHDKTQPKKKY